MRFEFRNASERIPSHGYAQFDTRIACVGLNGVIFSNVHARVLIKFCPQLYYGGATICRMGGVETCEQKRPHSSAIIVSHGVVSLH